MPRVSINIPTYNRVSYLRACIDSFFANTFKDFELVIADDGSVDDTQKFVKSLKDPRIKYCHQEHAGIPQAHNLARDNSVGEYIMSFGDDDLSLPDHLETLVDYLDEHPEIGAVYGDHQVWNGHVYVSNPLYTPISLKEDLKNLHKFQVYPSGGTLFRRSVFPEWDNTLESAVDWEQMFRCLESGTLFARVPKVLWTFRTGHKHEEGSQRQKNGCRTVLARRGTDYDKREL